jgi:hypothetical protein
MSDENQGQGQGGDQVNQQNTPPEGAIVFNSQAELDAKFAQHRRGLQKELAEARQKAASFDALQGQVSELLGSGIIDGVDDLEDFRNAASETINAAKSEAEQAALKNAKMEKDLQKANETAQLNQRRYETAMIERSISDEASSLVVDGHGREGALEYFQLKLGPKAKVQENGDVLVEWKVMNEDTGRMETKDVSVKAALQSMEAEPTKFGRYFKSTVNGGAGGETVDGIKRTADGNLDFANMDFQKFRELQAKNPHLLAEAANKLEF